MTNIATKFGRSDVQALPLYAPDATACAIDLSDNTNVWGAPPAVVRAVATAPSTVLSRYPSLYSEPLRDALLEYTGLAGVTGMGVATGCGSDDILDSTMRAFGAPGESIAFCAPTFSMIPTLARLNGLVPVALPFTDAFDIDAQRLVESAAKITYVCAPNNPTATAVSREALEYVVANAPGIVLVDEAYAEFAPEVFTDLLERNEHLVIARTFSKAFGMAGLRVGYALGAESTIRLIERARGPYKVTSLAERAVLAALHDAEDGVHWVRQHAALVVEGRARFTDALRPLGLEALPSAANFVMVPTERARELQRGLAARGILVRAFSGMRRDATALDASNGSALRIGIGPSEMMDTVIAALREVLA